MEFLVNMKAAGHDHGYQSVPSDPTFRVKAIESLLVDMKRFPGHEPPGRIHWPAESHRLFAEQLLPNVISALGGSRPGCP